MARVKIAISILFLISFFSISADASDMFVGSFSKEYGLTNIVDTESLIVADIVQGSSVDKIADFYIDYYTKSGDEDIAKLTREDILTMIIEWNGKRLDPSIVNDNNNKLLLLADKKMLLPKPSTRLGKMPFKDIYQKLESGKLLISGKTKQLDTPGDLSRRFLYDYGEEQLDMFVAANPGLFANNDFTKMQVEKTISYMTGPREQGDLSKVSYQAALLKQNYFSRQKLEYKVEDQTDEKLISLGFSIVTNDKCREDMVECLKDQVVDEIVKVIKEEGRDIIVYPIFDSDLFSLPIGDELASLPKGTGFYPAFGSNGRQYSLLTDCGASINNGFACMNDKIVLKYKGGKNQKTIFNFLLFDSKSSGSTFIDIVNIEYEIEYNNGMIRLKQGEFKKIPTISFPQPINKHTLVVLENNNSTRFALVTNNNEKENMPPWSMNTWNIPNESLYEIVTDGNRDDVFINKDNLLDYRDALQNMIMGEDTPIKYLFPTEKCNDRERIEIVYPNKKNDNINPLTVEYLPVGVEGFDFVGDCYLVSHRPTLGFSVGGKISSIHIYLHATGSGDAVKDGDAEIGKIVTKFKNLYKDLYDFESRSQTATTDAYYQLKDKKSGQFLEVYWHKTLPTRERGIVNHDDSLLIFNGHHKEGGLYFKRGDRKKFYKHLGRLSSQNYLLNVCGDPGKYPINEITTNSSYQNLIFPNKTILPEEAAISMFCSIRKFLDITSKLPPETCKPMMGEWVREVRTCMKTQLDTEKLKELSFHLIGHMEEEICRK